MSTVTISSWNPADYEPRSTIASVKGKNLALTVLKSRVSPVAHDTLRVELDPPKRVLDADSDACHIVRIDLLQAKVDWSSWYPTVLATGWLAEWRISDEVDSHPDGEARYVPAADPEWVPQFVCLEVQP